MFYTITKTITSLVTVSRTEMIITTELINLIKSKYPESNLSDEEAKQAAERWVSVYMLLLESALEQRQNGGIPAKTS